MQTWNMINMKNMETVELGVSLEDIHEIVQTANKGNADALWAAVEAD